MKVKPTFLDELKAIDSRLDIVENPNRPQLSNIKLDGVDICPIPREDIHEDPDPSHFMIAQNGWRMTHKSRKEALGMVMKTLEDIKDPEKYDIFFNK